MRWGRYSKEGGMRCRHYRGGKTEGGCRHSCSLCHSRKFLAGIQCRFSLLLSVIPDPDRGSSVFLLTNDKRKNPGSSITNVKDDRRRKAKMTGGDSWNGSRNVRS